MARIESLKGVESVKRPDPLINYVLANGPQEHIARLQTDGLPIETTLIAVRQMNVMALEARKRIDTGPVSKLADYAVEVLYADPINANIQDRRLPYSSVRDDLAKTHFTHFLAEYSGIDPGEFLAGSIGETPMSLLMRGRVDTKNILIDYRIRIPKIRAVDGEPFVNTEAFLQLYIIGYQGIVNLAGSGPSPLVGVGDVAQLPGALDAVWNDIVLLEKKE